MDKITKYKCSVCKREYDTEEEALGCENACRSPYVRYMLKIVPCTDEVSFSRRPDMDGSNLLDVEMSKMSSDSNDTFVFHMTRCNGAITEEDAKIILCGRAQEWLYKLSKKIDKLTSLKTSVQRSVL